MVEELQALGGIQVSREKFDGKTTKVKSKRGTGGRGGVRAAICRAAICITGQHRCQTRWTKKKRKGREEYCTRSAADKHMRYMTTDCTF